MFRLATAIAAVALAATGARASEGPGVGPAVILFGARWCAPCRGELGHLDALAAAAHPAVVTLAWIDGEPPLAELPDGVRVVPGAVAGRMFQSLAPDAAGLPQAVLVSRTGAVCARYPGPINAARLQSLMRGCGWR